jgi:mannose-1-phosphate guanylyltransferase
MILSEATHCLNSESYAFECGKLCFRSSGAMLSELGSYAFDLTEQCSSAYGAMLWTLRSMPLYTYRAVL